MNDLLQGKPLKHPLHTMLVHLPIGLFIMSLVLDMLSMALGDNAGLVRGAFYTMAFALAVALLAAGTGFVDWRAIRADHPAKRVGRAHMALNLGVIALYALNLALRYGSLDAPETPALPLLLSAIGVGGLLVSGYLGGMLVYDHGIGVGRHRRRTPTPTTTLHPDPALREQGGLAQTGGDASRDQGLALSALADSGARAGDWAPRGTQDGFVPVAPAASLQEGATLRVDAGGLVIAIARLGGDYYAFQEYCTHRFGPLSEGRLAAGQVECPWHRSCFDLRSGKVTAGPAKVDLKTFPVVVREDTLWVRTQEQQPLEERAVGQ